MTMPPRVTPAQMPTATTRGFLLFLGGGALLGPILSCLLLYVSLYVRRARPNLSLRGEDDACALWKDVRVVTGKMDLLEAELSTCLVVSGLQASPSSPHVSLERKKKWGGRNKKEED